MKPSFHSAAQSLVDEFSTLLPAEAASFTSSVQAYEQTFIERCSACADDTLLFTIKQTLKALKSFSVREFERRIREERMKLNPAAKLNGHAPGGWKELLSRNSHGVARPSLSNAMLAIRAAPEWQGILAYNQLSYRIEKLLPPPYATGAAGQWTDVDDIKLAEWFQLNGIEIGVTTSADAVMGVASEKGFHPIRAYLTSLKWDGEKRIARFLTDYFGVEWSELNSLISSRWLISAVARAMRPGCQVDTCLVLEGGQGVRKSTTLKALAGGPAFFTDQISNLEDKDASQDLAGKWIVEFPELDKFASKHDQGVIKSFIPRAEDHYRQSFGRRTQDWPRQCVFAASTTKFTWAGDETGARRWLPVRCGNRVDIEGVRRDRDQIWAEALAAFEDGIRWWFDETDPPTITQSLKDEQEARYDTDPWDAAVVEWLRLDQQKFAFDEAQDAIRYKRPPEPYFIQTDSILELCLKKSIGTWTQIDKIRVGKILTFHGFERFIRRVTTNDGIPVTGSEGKQKREWYYRLIQK